MESVFFKAEVSLRTLKNVEYGLAKQELCTFSKKNTLSLSIKPKWELNLQFISVR